MSVTATPTAEPQTLESPAYHAKGYAARSATSGLAPFSVPRRDLHPDDVQIEIQYCGVCHSDLHQVRNEWQNTMPTVYPCVPGHEIIGRVTKTGRAVKKFKEGDIAGVGCMVNSCGVCANCVAGDEQFCVNFPTLTYNAEDKILGGVTYGGYSESIVVREKFVLRVSDKFAKAFGANVVLFTTSPKKIADARRLGVDDVVISTHPEEMQRHAASFDFILDTVSADHDLNAYLPLLKKDGTMTLVGAPEKPAAVLAFNLIIGRHRLAGSAIGGIRETQEMLDFCADHGITSDIELIKIHDINQAYERLAKSDVKYRFVIDIASLK